MTTDNGNFMRKDTSHLVCSSSSVRKEGKKERKETTSVALRERDVRPLAELHCNFPSPAPSQ